MEDTLKDDEMMLNDANVPLSEQNYISSIKNTHAAQFRGQNSEQ